MSDIYDPVPVTRIDERLSVVGRDDRLYVNCCYGPFETQEKAKEFGLAMDAFAQKHIKPIPGRDSR